MHKRPQIITIAGGIGAGKSVVCRMLSILGYHIYDCDSHAKTIMDSSNEIKTCIANNILPSAITTDGRIDRKSLAEVVFNDHTKLEILNKTVHNVVFSDLRSWISTHKNESLLFVETAIPYSSGLSDITDDVWVVTAPESLRIKRVMNRSDLSYSQVKSRIENQASEYSYKKGYKIIINDGTEPLLPQIEHNIRTN